MSDDTRDVSKPCAVCGKESTSTCGNCRKYDVKVFYCCREHQAQDWKAHKKVCGANSGSAGGPEPCSRCLGACDGSRCRVEHPVHLRQDCGGSFCGGESRWDYICGACRQSFTVVNKDVGRRDSSKEKETCIEGARWCFDGTHSSKPLAASDERRVVPNAVYLQADSDIQAKIDAIPDDVCTLVITSAHGAYDESVTPCLSRPMKKLRTLQLIDVAFEQIHLTQELTPKLKSVSMQNVPDDCDLQVVLPSLREVSIQFWAGDGDAIDAMLAAATKLVSWDSYKLWSNHTLTFASNQLTSINLHRSDSLGELVIWAPSLARLSVQGCYGLDSIEFLKTHPLAASLPAGHTPPPTLEVNTLNANLGRAARRALTRNPRVREVQPEYAMPTEGLLAGMQAAYFG